jgi:hypothetical protein
MSQSSVLVPVARRHGMRRSSSSSTDANPRTPKRSRDFVEVCGGWHASVSGISGALTPLSPFSPTGDAGFHHISCGLKMRKSEKTSSRAEIGEDAVGSLVTADLCAAQDVMLSIGGPAQLKFLTNSVFLTRLRAALASDDRTDATMTIVTLVARNPSAAELVAGMPDLIEALINMVVCTATPPSGYPEGFPGTVPSDPVPNHLLCPKCSPAVDAAMYALYEVCDAYKPFCVMLSEHATFVKALTECFAPKANVASLWLLSLLMPKLPSEMRVNMCTRLLDVLATTVDLQREAVLFALRSCSACVQFNASLSETCVLRLFGILRGPDAPKTTKLGCLVVIKALCEHEASVREAVLECAGVLTSLVALVRDPEGSVSSQSLHTLYSVISRNTRAQDAFAAVDGVQTVVGRLCEEIASPTGRNGQVIERALTVLIAAVVAHTGNQRCVMVQSGLPKLLVTLLDSTLPRIRTLSAALIRSLVNRQPEFQPLFAALGALSRLLHMVTGTDGICVEQGVATLCQLAYKAELVQDLLLALCPAAALVTIVVDTKSSSSAVEYALLTLLMCVERSPEAFFAQLRSFHALPPALLRLCHTTNPNERCRATAERLLFQLDHDLYFRRQQAASGAILDELPLIPASPDCPSGVECAVCMVDVSDSDNVWVPCFHRFHRDCLKGWFATGKDSCPLCKTSVCGALYHANALE